MYNEMITNITMMYDAEKNFSDTVGERNTMIQSDGRFNFVFAFISDKINL